MKANKSPLSSEMVDQAENEPLIHHLTSAEEIQDWLANQIAVQIGEDPGEIDIYTPFNCFGLDSVQAMAIATLGKQQLGVEISPLVMWNCPNIDTLARYLAEEIARSETATFSI